MKTAAIALVLVALLNPGPARAHWCTNIYDAPARLVVKPERSTIPDIAVGEKTTLRVWVRNNFPYLLTPVEMQATSPDFEVRVQPGRQDLFPGQEAAFDFDIERTGETGDGDLHLQIRTFHGTAHTGGIDRWRGEGDPWVDPEPAEGGLRSGMEYGQAVQLNAATLADLYSEDDGVGRLLDLFGRPRLGYNNSGEWGDGAWFPPRALSNADYQLLRCGTELAIRRSGAAGVL
jgi:hypothetical protein